MPADGQGLIAYTVTVTDDGDVVVDFRGDAHRHHDQHFHDHEQHDHRHQPGLSSALLQRRPGEEQALLADAREVHDGLGLVAGALDRR